MSAFVNSLSGGGTMPLGTGPVGMTGAGPLAAPSGQGEGSDGGTKGAGPSTAAASGATGAMALTVGEPPQPGAAPARKMPQAAMSLPRWRVRKWIRCLPPVMTADLERHAPPVASSRGDALQPLPSSQRRAGHVQGHTSTSEAHAQVVLRRRTGGAATASPRRAHREKGLTPAAPWSPGPLTASAVVLP